MSAESIPDDLRRYILQCVPSVPYIEAVLLMRTNRDTPWTPELLARRLYLPGDDTLRLMSKLLTDGVVAQGPGDVAGYQYAPSSDELRSIWDRMAVVYAHHLIEVSTLIHSKPSGKAKILADAFVWRKEK